MPKFDIDFQFDAVREQTTVEKFQMIKNLMDTLPPESMPKPNPFLAELQQIFNKKMADDKNPKPKPVEKVETLPGKRKIIL
jgi:hypothetical protein